MTTPKNEIIERYGDDPRSMTLSLLEYADLAGDIGDRNKCIGIKPNLVCPTPASYGATTHPEIVEAIFCYLRECDFQNIIIVEGSWVGDKTSDAYEYCGYRALCEKYGVPFIDTQKDGAHIKDCHGMELSICDCVDSIDYLINVPVLKGHCQTKMTCALKNLKGLIPNSEKRKFHTMGLHKPIAHLAAGIRQDCIVVDHICGDATFEEGGNPVKTDCVMIGTDPVLIDSYACRILGLTDSDVPYIGQASSLGVGSTDMSKAVIRVIDEKGNEVRSGTGDSIVFKPERQLLDVSIAIDDCDACSACYASFTGALMRLKEEGVRIDDIPVMAIGQGHKDKTGKYGIGNCCRNYSHFVPGCPPHEDAVYEFIKKNCK